jgi:chemotaxis receptor (MCP) glutamine deamidase CheD
MSMTGAVLSRLTFTAHCGAAKHPRIWEGQLEAASSEKQPPKTPRAKRVTLYIGEVAATQESVVLDTLLGSCVAVCLFDPLSRIGGMNHILLPYGREGETTPRCGVHAMELLINEIMKLGGERRRFIAKAFGGAAVLRGTRLPPIGEQNANFVRRFLVDEQIPLVAERLGGDHAVHVYFHTNSGKATVHTVDGSSLPKIIVAERSFGKTIFPKKSFSGEITIF